MYREYQSFYCPPSILKYPETASGSPCETLRAADTNNLAEAA